MEKAFSYDPRGDTSDTQLWALTLSMEAVDIEPWTLGITVEWVRTANLLNISQTVSPSVFDERIVAKALDTRID
jgi:hypothetical protein